jgi:hypothetical protein
MKTLVNICIIGLFALMIMSSRGIAQTASTAETRLKELNITLSPVPPPIANYVDSVRSATSCFLPEIPRGPPGSTRARLARILRCKKVTTPPAKLDSSC